MPDLNVRSLSAKAAWIDVDIDVSEALSGTFCLFVSFSFQRDLLSV